MAIDQQQLWQAIYDLIFDSLTMAPAGSQPATSAASTMLGLSVPGIPLDPTEFANPWTPLNPNGDPVTSENFAALVDAVPEMATVFRASGNSLEALYGQIVQANTPAAAPPAPAPAPPAPAVAPPAPAPLSAIRRVALGANTLVAAPVVRDLVTPQRSVLNLATPKVQSAFTRLYREGTLATPRGDSIKTFVETPAFRTYLDRRAARDVAVTQYMTQYLQVDMKDPAEKQRWAAMSPALDNQVKSTTKSLQESDAGTFEEAMNVVSSSAGEGQNNSVAAIFSAARLNFELSKLGSMWGPGNTWHMSVAQPQNWFAPDASFFDVDLSAQRQLRTNDQSRFKQLGGQALSSGLWGFRGAQSKLALRPIATESIDLRVRFKFARINIRRPWFDMSLLSLGNWAMAGRRRNELSTGSLTGNSGLLPLLPTSIIVARDLQISATWSQAEVTFIRDRLNEKNLTFGPFALAGQYQRPRAKAATVASASFDGVNLVAPGLQVIGWMSKLVPACPPLDG